MRAFTCPVCRHLVAFENTQCLNCATLLAFDWDARTIDRLGYGCANRDLIGCNGTADPGRLCTACALTRTRPPDQAVIQWSVAEVAKRRLVVRGPRARPADRRRPDVRHALERARARSSPATPTASSRSTWPRPTPSTASRPAPSSTSPTAPSSGTCATRSATTTSRSSCATGDALPRALRRRSRGLPGRARSPLPRGSARRLAATPRLGLRDDASVGGLGGDVRPLPAHPRRAADRGRLRRQRRPGPRWRPATPRRCTPIRAPRRTTCARCSTRGSR